MAFSRTAKGSGESRVLGLLLVLVGVLGVSLLLALSLTKTSAFLVLGALVGALLLAACFLSPELGVAILIMSMLLSPEIGAGALGGASLEAGRSVVIRLDDILLVILSAAWFARTAVHKDLGLILKSPLNRPIGFYVLSCFVSTLLGFMTGNVLGKVGFFFVIRYIEYFIVFFIAINFLNSRQIMRRFMNIAFFTAALIALYGMYQIPSGVRVSAPFEGDAGEPNTMGGYLLLIMCMAAGQLVTARGLRPVLGWSAYIFFLFIPLLFTGSRASWLGIPAVMLAFFIFSQRKKEVAILTLLFLAAGPVILPQSVKDRILFTFRQTTQVRGRQLQIGGVRLDTSTSARLETYKAALSGWSQKPIQGWGVTGFFFVDSQWVRTLVETGLIGMVAFLWLVWGYFQSGRAAMRAAPDRYQLGLAIGYLAGLFGLLVHGVAANTFIILRIMEPWMLFTAIVVRIPGIAVEREKRWDEIEREEEELAGEGPPEEAAPAGPAGGGVEAPPSGRKFQKRPSEHEEFLEREKTEMERRAKEARRKGADLPRFRRRETDKTDGPPPRDRDDAGAASRGGAHRKRARNIEMFRRSDSNPSDKRRP